MTEMIERVAKAIDGQMAEDNNAPEDLSRAALVAVRVPTWGMVTAAIRKLELIFPSRDFLPSDIESMWHAMIDEALK